MIGEQFVGQQRWVEYFQSVIAADRLATGYLFVGPAHIGKKTLALQLAKQFLCQTTTACGACATCRAWQERHHPDVVVLAPSEKGGVGIEEVREFTEEIGKRSYAGQRRFALISQADRLTLPAANALLKTLEEPPRGVIVVAVTERAEALPATVRSRLLSCQFAPVATAVVAAALRERGVLHEQAERFARLSRGCPGKALLFATEAQQETDAAAEAKVFFTLLAAPMADRLAYTESVATEDRCPKAQLEMRLATWQGYLHDLCRAAAGVPELAAVVPASRLTQPLPRLVVAAEALQRARRDIAGVTNRRLALNTFFLSV